MPIGGLFLAVSRVIAAHPVSKQSIVAPAMDDGSTTEFGAWTNAVALGLSISNYPELPPVDRHSCGTSDEACRTVCESIMARSSSVGFAPALFVEKRVRTMSQRIVVTGTDTGIGKTVSSAGLADLLGANYWKPIQTGLKGETDSQLVARLGGLSADRIAPELYRLQTQTSSFGRARWSSHGCGVAQGAGHQGTTSGD